MPPIAKLKVPLPIRPNTSPANRPEEPISNSAARAIRARRSVADSSIVTSSRPRGAKPNSAAIRLPGGVSGLRKSIRNASMNTASTVAAPAIPIVASTRVAMKTARPT
jgi:hypothetical protein